MKLNERQKRFADEYIISGNIAEAAVKAGYSENYANAQGYKLLENVGIKGYIEDRMKEIKSSKIADQTEIMEFLTAVIRGQVTEPVLVLDGDGIQRIEHLPPSVNVRRSAAVDAGKRYGMWTDKQQVDTTQRVVIVNDVPLDD